MTDHQTGSSVVLYTTSGCHLCEQAEALLRALSVAWQAVEIAADDDLLERYGMRIPVVLRSDGAELGWPFDEAGLAGFLPNSVD